MARSRPWWLSLNVVGVLALLVAFGASLYRINVVRHELFDPDTTIIRIGHWHLELGYRDALAEIIADYERLQAKQGRNVRVLQMAVTEKVYAQWLNVNVISGQAPDLAGMGMSRMLYNEEYIARYFVPLTQVLTQPNPYNKGTDLEDVPWRETFFDGMRNSYNQRLQDYFSVPTTVFNLRLFYNKDMLRRATGSDVPPGTFGELMEACEKIRQLAERENRIVIPIAGSQYMLGVFRDRYTAAFTAGLEAELDLDLSGTISEQEAYIGFVTGKISMDSPEIKNAHLCLRRLCEEFGRGFGGKDRQTAAFEFVQERAAMIATGSWDARSLFEQAKETGFEVGIFDFPLPGPGEPFGEHIVGKATEATSGSSGSFGLYKFSRNQDQALDFLQYLTSREVNRKHMEMAEWIPVVLGNEPTGRMQAFASDPIGFSSRVTPFYGADVRTMYIGESQSYFQGEQSYERLAEVVTDAMNNRAYGGDRAWTLEWDATVKQTRNQERVLAAQVVRAMMLDAEDAPEKHRQTLLQQLRANNAEGHRHLFEQVRGFPLPEK